MHGYQPALLDAAPNPVSIGVALAVIIFVVGFVCLLAVALVVFLWYRKKRMSGIEIVERAPLEQTQPSNPNHP
jgi:hypothetical protein